MAYHYAVLICFFVVVFSGETNAEAEFHRIKVVDQGVEVLEDVLYDKNNKVALVNVVGQRTGDKNICQTSNFHDLERQLVAMKHMETGRCYLARSEETPSQIESVIRNGTAYNPKSLTYKVRKNNVPAEHLEDQAGKKIANFCKDYDTRWLVKVPGQRSQLIVEREANFESCVGVCIVCTFKETVPGGVVGTKRSN